MLRTLSRDDSAATLTEYGLIVALITVVSLIVLGALGDQIHGAFCTVETALAADAIGTASTDC
jgi:Flp pilus assembly pilin Flp